MKAPRSGKIPAPVQVKEMKEDQNGKEKTKLKKFCSMNSRSSFRVFLTDLALQNAKTADLGLIPVLSMRWLDIGHNGSLNRYFQKLNSSWMPKKNSAFPTGAALVSTRTGA